MSLKTKLTSLITTFVLLCSLLTVGVFAVKNTTFNVGGDIVFDVKGIEADIELTANGVQNAVLADNAVAGTDVMNKIEIRNNTSAESVASQFAKWSNLNMTFAEGQSTATIELKITNRATEEDNYIDITALADATTKDNARIKVANNAGGITALLKSGENATFTITFSVINDEYKASLNDFSVNFDMQKKVLNDFPVLSQDMTYETLKFRTIQGQNGLSVEDISVGVYDYQSTGNLIIPAYVNNNGTVYAVTKIAYQAFGSDGNGVSSITSVIIPNTITEIGDEAFAFCSISTGVIIPSSVTSIGEMAFADCSGLTSVTIGNSVTSIGAIAFSGCTSLTSITIPDSVTNIGECTFAYSGLTSITIPYSVTGIEGDAFVDNPLTTVNYTGTQAQWNALLENIAEGNDPLLSATVNFI